MKIENGILVSCDKNIRNLIVPYGVTKLGNGVFNMCSELTSITLPDTITDIGNEAFCFCVNLTNIILPDSIVSIGYGAFDGCSGLKSITLPNNLKKIGTGAFTCCSELTSIILPDTVTELEDWAFCGCRSLKSIKIPTTVTEISENAFVGCEELKEVVWGEKRFNMCNIITYETIAYKDLEVCDKALQALTNSQILFSLETLNHLVQNSTKGNFNEKFVHFNKRFKNIDLSEGCFTKENLAAFCKFAYNIGCFSDDAFFRQKACEWLYLQVANQNIQLDQMGRQFEEMPIMGENTEFSEFIMGTYQKRVTNFEKILEFRDYGNFLTRIYKEYQNPNKLLLKGGRYRDKKNRLMFAVFVQSENEHGHDNSKRKELKPTIELFINYFKETLFHDIENLDDQQIANELSKWQGMEQFHFDRAKSIMKEFNETVGATNIVGEHLKDIENEIYQYKQQTEKLAKQGLKVAEEILDKLGYVAQKEFSYEWLEKNDPMNFCLGLYCNCCANLAGVGYGIMRANFVRDDVQNLVIKDGTGNPVAKATIYVNKEQGYAVFNNVEVSDFISEEQKDEIYQEFMQGVKIFAEKYNEHFPQKPIEKITVGMHLNDLEHQITDIKNGHRISEILECLNYGDYGIDDHRYAGDWQELQYLIWENKPQDDGEESYEECY